MNINNSTVIKTTEFQRSTQFSIDDILGPEFGKKRTENRLRNLYTNYHQILSRVTPLNPFQSCLSDNASDFVRCSGEIVQRSWNTAIVDKVKTTKSFDSCIKHECSFPNGCSRIRHHKDPKYSATNPNTRNRQLGDAVTSVHMLKEQTAIEGDCLVKSSDRELPAWVYCTRYSDRPSSGPRSRKVHRKSGTCNEKRPRTIFTSDQLKVLQTEFRSCRYLTEHRRQNLASDLCLNESQIKIWFQNKRAKQKRRPLIEVV